MSEIPTRKNHRLTEFDYSQNGTYFVTICTRDKQKIFWDNHTIAKTSTGKFVGDGALDVPYKQLSDYGKIVNYEITRSNKIYNHIQVDKYVIMPNHIHMILIVCNNQNGTSRAPSPTNQLIPSFVSMLKRFTNKKCGISLWQRSYYDHIIRNQLDYDRVWQYIDENPLKWELDEYYVK